MEVIDTIKGMMERADEIRMEGKTISFVPTMGFLHRGHLELMKEGGRKADFVIASIFVNPTQFGPGEDYDKYPRDMEGDLKKAKDAGVDIVYVPSVEEMYPDGFQSKVSVERVTNHLCGLFRPGHFDGVTTVVNKLFNITRPHMAIFGQKDFQQLAVIRRMVKDLNMGIKIIGFPIVREPDGLAMSSRNKYLNAGERKSALSLKKSIDMAQEMVKAGEVNAEKIRSSINELIISYPYTNIEYVAVCDPLTLEDVERIRNECLLAIAVKVGATRLIDNCILTSDGREQAQASQ